VRRKNATNGRSCANQHSINWVCYGWKSRKETGKIRYDCNLDPLVLRNNKGVNCQQKLGLLIRRTRMKSITNESIVNETSHEYHLFFESDRIGWHGIDKEPARCDAGVGARSQYGTEVVMTYDYSTETGICMPISTRLSC
jgi:hypothetical protein